MALLNRLASALESHRVRDRLVRGSLGPWRDRSDLEFGQVSEMRKTGQRGGPKGTGVLHDSRLSAGWCLT